jgi:hypothetical protein
MSEFIDKAGVRARALASRVSGRESARLHRHIAELEQRVARSGAELDTTRAQLAAAESGSPRASGAHPVEYSPLAPAPRNALGLFPNEWSSVVPGGSGPGATSLFDDERIAWMIEQLGGVAGLDVLELGPLEAGHTYMLEQAGARVDAIEGNHNSFLRCLIVKNLLGLESNFVLGDFSESFGERDHWDLVLASGVLYHMTRPVELLERMAAVTDRIMLWTHYYEPDLSLWHPGVRSQVGTKWRPESAQTTNVAGVSVRTVPQLYAEALGWSGFCGGPETQSVWMYRQDLLDVLAALGLSNIEVAFDDPGHVNGPAFCVLATRDGLETS